MSAINPEQADKILRMTGELASQVLRARVIGRPISKIEAMALTDALQLLQDFEIDWPDTLTSILKQHDEMCSHEDNKFIHQRNNDAELIRLPQVNALPRRIFSMLGLG